MPKPIRIAMWSGPRNISTAMMRAFESRSDCAVMDEPFYAAYLAATGIKHPMREAVLDAGETDWRRVIDLMTGPVPNSAPIFYQKHMTHHILPQIALDWMADFQHAFLIRHPNRVLASYARKRQSVAIEDLGYHRQVEIYKESGGQAPVIDADRFLANPRGHLVALCRHLQIPFLESMLAWKPGPRESDGIWAAHWYESVYQSTKFHEPGPMPTLIDRDLLAIRDAILPAYEWMANRAFTD